jgi:hypothetical protein
LVCNYNQQLKSGRVELRGEICFKVRESSNGRFGEQPECTADRNLQFPHPLEIPPDYSEASRSTEPPRELPLESKHTRSLKAMLDKELKGCFAINWSYREGQPAISEAFTLSIRPGERACDIPPSSVRP